MQASDAASLARELMNTHGYGHWTFQFDRAKKRAGCCKYRRQVISLSVYYVANNSIEEITDTILHEIAHAIAGKDAGHGPCWKHVCRRIGANPERCYDSAKVVMPKGRWLARCSKCGHEFRYHRRPKRIENKYHIPCGRESKLLLNLVG